MLYEYTFLGTPSVNMLPITSSLTPGLKSDRSDLDTRNFWVDKNGRINYNYAGRNYTDVRFTDNNITYQSTNTSLPKVSGMSIGEGRDVWEMNGHIYYNFSSTVGYELNDSNQWVEKTWTFNLTNPGDAYINGMYMWHLGNDYYGIVIYSGSGAPINRSVTVKYNALTGAWDEYTTASGAISPLDLDSDAIFDSLAAYHIWDDGINAYYSYYSYQYIWDKTKLGWVAFSHTAVKKDGTIISNYEFAEPVKVNGDIFTIAKSTYPNSNWKTSPREVYKWNSTTQRWEYYSFVVDPYEKTWSLYPESTYVTNNKIYVYTTYPSSFTYIPWEYAPHRIIT